MALAETLRGRKAASTILFIVVWASLVAAIAECVLTLVLDRFGLLYWRILHSLTPEILFIVPLFDLALFGLLGLVAVGIACLLPKLSPVRVGVFLAAAVLSFTLLAVTGHTRGYVVLGYYFLGLSALIGLAAAWWAGPREQAILALVHRSFLLVVLCTVIVVAGWPGMIRLREWRLESSLGPAAAGSPNVLLIVMDTLRADHFSSYGYPRQTSPNIDRLGREGVLFEKAISPSSWTLPVHGSLLTGLYPREHGAETRPLDDRPPSIVETFRAKGYRTGAFSGNHYYFCRRMGFGRGFSRFEDYAFTTGNLLVRTLYGRLLARWLPESIMQHFPSFFRDAPDVNRSFLRWADRDSSRPFFAVLNYFDAHDPYYPPLPYRRKFLGNRYSPEEEDRLLLTPPPPKSAEQLKAWEDAYDGAINFVDDQVAWLAAQVEQRGALANTVLIITADHGESFGEHGLTLHANALYPDNIHVPLILRWPGRVPSGVRVAQPVTLADIPATLMDLTGVAPHNSFAGLALTNLWRSPRETCRPFPLSEVARLPFNPKALTFQGWMKSLVTPRWHYIVHEKRGEELYEWRKDPQEKSNLARAAGMEQVLEALRQELAARDRTGSRTTPVDTQLCRP